MNIQAVTRILTAIREAAHPLSGGPSDYDPLLKRIEDARLVLIGEASHGTHEFYRHRAQITKRLITEKGFRAVAVEADWPDAYRVNTFVRGQGEDAEAIEPGYPISYCYRTRQWRCLGCYESLAWNAPSALFTCRNRKG